MLSPVSCLPSSVSEAGFGGGGPEKEDWRWRQESTLREREKERRSKTQEEKGSGWLCLLSLSHSFCYYYCVSFMHEHFLFSSAYVIPSVQPLNVSYFYFLHHSFLLPSLSLPQPNIGTPRQVVDTAIGFPIAVDSQGQDGGWVVVDLVGTFPIPRWPVLDI